MQSKPKLITISGATASGKTKLAIELALKYQAEIISFDSRQIYKELNIGVARPSEDELAQVPHHLIAHKSIQDTYNVQEFINDFYNLTLNSKSQNQNYILVGGTGFYLKALIDGIDDLPDISSEVREKVEQDFKEKGLTFLQNQVETIDPQSYATIDINNPRRLQRIIEIWEEHNLVYSELIQKKSNPLIIELYTIRNIVLDISKEILYQRINERVDNMILEGLEDEVIRLYPYRNLNALQTVGYREIFDSKDGKMNLNEAIDKIKQHTRNYAKRQITWNKKYLSEALWINPFENQNYFKDLEHYIFS